MRSVGHSSLAARLFQSLLGPDFGSGIFAKGFNRYQHPSKSETDQDETVEVLYCIFFTTCHFAKNQRPVHGCLGLTKSAEKQIHWCTSGSCLLQPLFLISISTGRVWARVKSLKPQQNPQKGSTHSLPNKDKNTSSVVFEAFFMSTRIFGRFEPILTSADFLEMGGSHKQTT